METNFSLNRERGKFSLNKGNEQYSNEHELQKRHYELTELASYSPET